MNTQMSPEINQILNYFSIKFDNFQNQNKKIIEEQNKKIEEQNKKISQIEEEISKLKSKN